MPSARYTRERIFPCFRFRRNRIFAERVELPQDAQNRPLDPHVEHHPADGIWSSGPAGPIGIQVLSHPFDQLIPVNGHG